MPKKEVITPQGERVLVRRRSWPWPNFTGAESLEAIGMARTAAQWLGREPRGDLAVAGLIGLPFLLCLLIGAWAVLGILTLILTIFLLVFYLALPWAIEVVHEGAVVESEAVAGSVKAKARVDRVAGLYQSGAVRLPSPPPPPEPERKSALPRPGHLPELKERDLDFRPSLRDLDEAVLPTPDAVLPQPTQGIPTGLPAPTSTPEASSRPEASPVAARPETPMPPSSARSGESPLRRAIRLAEEEEREAYGTSAARPEVDRRAAKRARPSKSGRAKRD